LRLFELFGVLLNAIHQDFALSHVARDFREADDVIGVVAKRRNHHVRPESGTVFPDAPAFALVMTLFARSLQHSSGETLPDVFRSVEERKVLANNFLRGVA